MARRSQGLKRVGDSSSPFPGPPRKAKVIPISQMGKQVEAAHLRTRSPRQNWDQRPWCPTQQCLLLPLSVLQEIL